MTEYTFKIYCQYCKTEYKVQYSLPLDNKDIQCTNCGSYDGQQILDIEKVVHCNCSKCTGMPSIEDYYKDED